MSIYEFETKAKEKLPAYILAKGIPYYLYCTGLLGGGYQILYHPCNPHEYSYSDSRRNFSNLLGVVHDNPEFCIEYIKYELSSVYFGGGIEIDYEKWKRDNIESAVQLLESK